MTQLQKWLLDYRLCAVLEFADDEVHLSVHSFLVVTLTSLASPDSAGGGLGRPCVVLRPGVLLLLLLLLSLIHI